MADFRDKKLTGLDLEVCGATHRRRARSGGWGFASSEVAAAAGKEYDRHVCQRLLYADAGFTVERDVTWFRYGDIPEAFRREIANNSINVHEADANQVNTYDIIYPVYGPTVGVLTITVQMKRGGRTITLLRTGISFRLLR